MKRALIIIPELGNNYESLTPTLEQIAKELSTHYFTHTVKISSPSLLRLILEVGDDSENIIFYGWFGYDLAVYGLNIGAPINLCDNLNAKQFAIVDDPLFASWMYGRIKSASSKLRFICTADILAAQVDAIRGNPSRTTVLDLPAPAPTRDLRELPTFDSREYDLLIPCSATVTDPKTIVDSGVTKLGQVAQVYFNSVASSLNISNYFLFDSFTFSRDFFFSHIPSLRNGCTHPLEFGPILEFVWSVDAWVRHSFRIEIIKYFAGLKGLKILLLSDSGLMLEGGENFQISGPVYGKEFSILLANAKYVIDIAIPGCPAVHIRAKSAYAMGAAVLSNNPRMINLLDSSDFLNPDVNRLLDPVYWNTLRTKGYNYISSLSYKNIIDDMIKSST
jgi:hypothetical protein